MQKFIRLGFKVFYGLLSDIFSKNYTYHASAITFSAFLVSNTAVIFLGTVLKYIPKKEQIIQKIYELFPQISENIVQYFVQSVENLTVKVQLITLILVIFFIGNFLRTVEVAFAFVGGTNPRKLPIVNYILPFVFGFLLVFYGSLDVILNFIPKLLAKLHIYHPLVVKITELIKVATNYFAFPLGVAVIYYFLSPKRVRFRITLGVSLILTLLLNPLKGLFSWYATHFLVKNLVITPFAGILIFLVWLYVMALFLLFGYRLILLLHRF